MVWSDLVDDIEWNYNIEFIKFTSIQIELTSIYIYICCNKKKKKKICAYMTILIMELCN